jgi:hypothetical protein
MSIQGRLMGRQSEYPMGRDYAIDSGVLHNVIEADATEEDSTIVRPCLSCF